MPRWSGFGKAPLGRPGIFRLRLSRRFIPETLEMVHPITFQITLDRLRQLDPSTEQKQARFLRKQAGNGA
jgi:hypothetical protein